MNRQGSESPTEKPLASRDFFMVSYHVRSEQGIEKALLQDEKGDVARVNEWVELTNGCLCCSVKDDFVNALESLMLQQTRFDYILIETTGLADPGPVAAALWTDEELEAGVKLGWLSRPRCIFNLGPNVSPTCL
jgi:hypothetical protein